MQQLASWMELSTSITHLLLDGAHVNDAGIAALGHALAINTSLQVLSLNRNFINDDGGEALAAGARAHVSLQHLRLERNSFLELRGCTALVDAAHAAPDGALHVLLPRLEVPYHVRDTHARWEMAEEIIELERRGVRRVGKAILNRLA